MAKSILEKKKKAMSKGQRIVMTLMLIFFIVYSLTLIYPMVWMVLSSLKGSLEYEAGNAFALPKKWLFSNYLDAFTKLEVKKTGFFGMVWNSLWMSGLSIFIGAIGSAMICYVMAKLRFPGQKIIYTIIILQMIIPTYGSFSAVYKLKRDLGLYNNVLNIIVSSIGVGGYRFLVLYAFYKGVSWTYAEAGFMDGATQFQVFWKIMFPMVLGPIATFAMTDFIGAWNDYMSPLMYMPSFPTLASGLYEYESNMIRAVNYPVYFAGVTLSVIPIITLFIIFRDTFMSSMNVGGIKG